MRNGRRVVALLSFLLLCCGVHVHAQRMAVKTNTLGWLTASPMSRPNLFLGRHISLNMESLRIRSVQTIFLKLLFHISAGSTLLVKPSDGEPFSRCHRFREQF